MTTPDSPLTVYGNPLSTCTRRVLFALREKGVPYELVAVDLRAGEHKSPEFLKLQPFGQIPVLQDGTFTLFESRAICRYIERKYRGHGTSLIPEGAKEAGIVDEWCSVEQAIFDPPCSGLVSELLFKKSRGLEHDPLRARVLVRQLEEVMDVYERHLSDGKEYLAGEFSLADLFHAPYGVYLAPVGLLPILTTPSRPHVKAWWERLVARKAWREVEET
ncbi:thioredoxin-like protein [Gonapodya prolifera JEL478]|uniref:glutathione transferase n=1 Tax=Gonapodya prolifera (strain JEL478) TaxID=1344416 RepID=A0A139AYH0_GONPJ|nr:thioredoxin-like protein [Gonapodya prolifera JEL478]|eukprot:KXS21754.1 thioredoxin-like protein [Gonapodya prolifera JEL478]